MSKILDLVCASEVKEFFYKEDNIFVSEGQPVGVDIESGDEVRFILFNNIYWSPDHETTEEEV
jgi:hypothetical protein